MVDVPEQLTGALASSINVKLPNGKYIHGVLAHMLPDVDFDNVNSALDKLPGMLAYISVMHADACYYADTAKLELARTKAIAETTIRRESEARITVSEVESRVLLDPSVMSAADNELIAKHHKDVLKAAVDTVTRTLDSYKEISYNIRREANL